MALVHAALIGWTGSEVENGPEYELRYYVKTDTREDGPATVRSYSGWTYGAQYNVVGLESDSRARCVEISERPINNDFMHWEVTVKFKTPEREEEEDPENPLADALEISWDVETRQQLRHRDAAGEPILTSSYEQFEDPVYSDDFRRKLTVVRNEASFNKTVADALSNGVNNATWNGYAAKTVKLEPITSQAVYHTLIGQYWKTTYRFSFAAVAEEWKEYRLQEGFYELYTDGGTQQQRRINIREPIMNSDGTITGYKWVPSPTRQLLDANGARLATGGTAVYKEIETLKPVNFGLLNMDALDLT